MSKADPTAINRMQALAEAVADLIEHRMEKPLAFVLVLTETGVYDPVCHYESNLDRKYAQELCRAAFESLAD